MLTNDSPRIGVLVGSVRPSSFNQRLVNLLTALGNLVDHEVGRLAG